MMSTAADAALGFAQTLGFAVKGWTPLAIAAGGLETLLDLFFPSSQVSVVDVVVDARDEIIDAIEQEGEAILGGMWQTFANQYLAEISTAQDAYATTFGGLMAQGNVPAGAEGNPIVVSVETSDFQSWLGSVQAQTGSTSPLLDACHFVELQADQKYTSIHLYLLSATVFLSYCKLGLLMESMQITAKYQKQLADYKAGHPDWNQHPEQVPTVPRSAADLTHSVYFTLMTQHVAPFLDYAEPIVTTLRDNIAALQAAVDQRARDFVLKQDSSGRWYYEDVRTHVTSAPTDQATATVGMQLQVGMATTQETSEQETRLGLVGIDHDQVKTSAQTIEELKKTRDLYKLTTS